MPADYLAMKEKFIEEGMSTEDAEAKAAKIHNAHLKPGEEAVGSHEKMADMPSSQTIADEFRKALETYRQ